MSLPIKLTVAEISLLKEAMRFRKEGFTPWNHEKELFMKAMDSLPEVMLENERMAYVLKRIGLYPVTEEDIRQSKALNSNKESGNG